MNKRPLKGPIRAVVLLMAALGASPVAAQGAADPRAESADGLTPPHEVRLGTAGEFVAEPLVAGPDVSAPPPADESLARTGSFRVRAGLDIVPYGGAAQSGAAIDLAPRANWQSLDLKPNVGVQLTGLAPLGRVVLLGGALSWRSVVFRDDDLPPRIDKPGRVGVFGLQLQLGVHYGIDLGPVALDPFLLLGGGLALGYGDEALSPQAVGVEVSLRVGTDLWFSRAAGASISLAYRRSDFYQTDRDATMGSRHTTLRQLVIELGIVLRAS